MANQQDSSAGEVTVLLAQAGAGERDALDRLYPLIYSELTRIAQRQARRERADHTLGASALVNEAYLKLLDQTKARFQDREHFYSVAARAMKQVLIDHARKRNAEKRGAGAHKTTLDGKELGLDAPLEEVLALDQALDRLENVDQRLRQVVEFRFYCGLTEQETADVLGVNVRTIQRAWLKARAWLYKELYPDRI